MNNKKKNDINILERFKEYTKIEFDILDSLSAKKIFNLYNDENPDLLIKYEGGYIGIELSLLSLDNSISPVNHGGKKYKNHMHKLSKWPDSFNNIEEAEKYIKTEVNSKGFQDDLFDILKKKLPRKVKKSKQYVTKSNWIIFHTGGEFFNLNIVKNIYEDCCEDIVNQYIAKILTNYPVESKKIKRIFLYEFGTSQEDYMFEYKNFSNKNIACQL